MPKKTATISVNLLAGTTFEASSLGKILGWVLTVGKVIVFINFFIVIFAFAYRFIYLDPKLDNLNTKIDENVEAIQAYSAKEAEIVSFQEKLDLIDSLTKPQIPITTVLQKIEESLPHRTHFENLTINKDSIEFKGTSPNEMSFSALLAALKKQPDFSEIVINELYSGGVVNPEVRFSISLKITNKV